MTKGSKIKNSLMQLKRLDMFGVPITIRFEGNTNHKTIFGAIMTLFIMFLLIIQVIEAMKSFINYENYTVIYQENIVKQPTEFILQQNKFTFAFGIQDTFLKTLLDEQIYYIEAVFADTRRNLNPITSQYEFDTKYINFKPIPCTPQHFQVPNTQDYFLKLPYRNLYCIPLDIKMSLEGQYGADIYKWLRFRIKKCVNPNTCKPAQEVESRLNNCNFQVYYINYAVEITDKDQPFKPIAQNTFWKPSNTLKNINMYFRNAFINSDEGLFKQQITQHQSLLYSFDREQIVNTQSDVMFEVYVQLEKNKESQYIRKYQKFNSVISQLGGLFNFLFAIGAILCFPFSKLVLHQKLLNNLFKFQRKCIKNKPNNNNNEELDIIKESTTTQQQQLQYQTENSPKQQNLITPDQQTEPQMLLDYSKSNPQSIIEIKSPVNRERFTIVLDNNQSQKQTKNLQNLPFQFIKNQQNENLKVKKLEEQLSSTKKHQNKLQELEKKYEKSMFRVSLNQIKVKISDICKSAFLASESYDKMINYGLEKLNYNLDIQTIITKLLEVEKLKQLLLNEEQMKLFEFIPQPVIHEEMFESNKIDDIINAQEQNPLLKTGIFYEDKRTLLEKASDAQTAYNKIFKNFKKDPTNIDKKLLSLLDPRLSSRFDQNVFLKQYDVFSPNLKQQQFQKQINPIDSSVLLGHRQNTKCNKEDEALPL